MTEETTSTTELKGTGYELFIAALSVLSIANIVLLYAISDDDLRTVLLVMNVVLSVIFLVDFFYRLFTAASKSRYFFREFGWADLLASLPFEQAKVLRVFRLFRVARLMRTYGAKNIARSLVKDRAGSALFMLLLMGLLVIEFGSLAMLGFEKETGNIENASDAIWYTIVTISTVGYGDRFPVTNSGRVLGSVILVLGVGIFGAFTGYLANLFLSPKKQAPVVADDPGRRLAELKELVVRQQAAVDELEGLLGRAP